MSKKSLNILKTSLIAVFLVLSANPAQAAGEITIKNFSLSPTTVPNNTGNTQFQMKFGVTVNLTEISKTCGDSTNSFDWYVYQIGGLGPNIRASGEEKFGRGSLTIDVNIDKSITIENEFGSNYDAIYRGKIYCKGGKSFLSLLGESKDFKVKYGSTSNKKWACVGSDNKYACSPLNLSNCSDVPSTKGCPTASNPCLPEQIGSNLCGEDAGTSPTPTPTPTPGGGKTTVFKIDNPIEADNLVQLLDVIATWLFNIAIPIMVAMIVYAGIIFLVSRGDTAKVSQAKKILLYAVVGFTIILIGKGFITLIESILNLGKSV